MVWGATPSTHGGGGYSIQSWWGGYPIQSWWGGYPIIMVGGYPPTIQTWPMGPHPVMGGYPPTIRPGMGYPPPTIRPGMGDGVPPPTTIRPGMGHPLPHHPDLGYPPPTIQTWDGAPPPPPMVNRQTFPSINITFPRTTYAGGKKLHYAAITLERKPKQKATSLQNRLQPNFQAKSLSLQCKNNWQIYISIQSDVASFSIKYNSTLGVELYWGESERKSDIAWNGYIDFQVACLYWVAAKIKEIFAFAFGSI